MNVEFLVSLGREKVEVGEKRRLDDDRKNGDYKRTFYIPTESNLEKAV